MGLLENKIALITGCRGICQATEILFAREGADLAITYLHAKPTAENNVKKIRAMGRKAIAINADLRKIEDVKRVVKKTMEEFGRIDVLVNCAGIYTYISAEEVTEENFDLDMDTNVKATFFCCQEVAKAAMIPRKKGRIVNIASMAGFRAFPNLPVYDAAKAAIIQLTKDLAFGWAKYNITVNCISPGYVATERFLEAIKKGDVDGEAIKRQSPLNRLGNPEEIAEAIAWLASDKCPYITGANLVADGGYTIGIRFASLKDGEIVMW